MEPELVFPDDATAKERKAFSVKIGAISDADFGFATIPNQPPNYRFCVRCILLNDAGMIGLVESTKYHYYQILGGGIDPGETIEVALRREVREEMGYEINQFQPLGYFYEKKEGELNSRPSNRNITFVYSATPGKEVGTNYTDEEINEGFTPTWKSLDFAIDFKEKHLRELAENDPENYGGAFVTLRDLKILEFFRDRQSNLN